MMCCRSSIGRLSSDSRWLEDGPGTAGPAPADELGGKDEVARLIGGGSGPTANAQDLARMSCMQHCHYKLRPEPDYHSWPTPCAGAGQVVMPDGAASSRSSGGRKKVGKRRWRAKGAGGTANRHTSYAAQKGLKQGTRHRQLPISAGGLPVPSSTTRPRCHRRPFREARQSEARQFSSP